MPLASGRATGSFTPVEVSLWIVAYVSIDSSGQRGSGAVVSLDDIRITEMRRTGRDLDELG